MENSQGLGLMLPCSQGSALPEIRLMAPIPNEPARLVVAVAHE